MTYADLAAAVKTGTLKPEGPEMAFAPSQLRYAIWQAYQGDISAAQSVHDYMVPEWHWCLSYAQGKPQSLAALFAENGIEVGVVNELPARAWLEAVLRAKETEKCYR